MQDMNMMMMTMMMMMVMVMAMVMVMMMTMMMMTMMMIIIIISISSGDGLGELGEAITSLSIETEGDLPTGRILSLLTSGSHQILAGESRWFETINDLSIGALEELLKLLLLTVGVTVQAEGFLDLGQFLGIDGRVIRFGGVRFDS